MSIGCPARKDVVGIGARSENLLRAEGLAAFRGDRLVLRDVSFTVEAGGALVLGGANGSGKSTLLRLLAGLLRPAAGQIFLNDIKISRETKPFAYIGHQDAVKPGLDVAENLAFFARLAGREADTSAALDAVGLGALADLPARMLSAGQRRRLALARLGVSCATVWLLDEPTLGLDADSVAALGRLFTAHRAEGGVIVAATHLPLPLPKAALLQLQ